jgi:hypothetical protein
MPIISDLTRERPWSMRYHRAMPRDGSLILSDVRDPRWRWSVSRADGGHYNVDGLLEEHGDVKLTDLLRTFADCPKTRSAIIHDRCKAVYEGLWALALLVFRKPQNDVAHWNQ